MEQIELHHELLLRYLDGNLSPVEEAEVNDLLGRDPEARAFLRQGAEQAVTIADMQRTEDNHNLALEMEVLPDQKNNPGQNLSPRDRSDNVWGRWPWIIATAALITMIVNIYFLAQQSQVTIGQLTESSGWLRWTGDGGQVFDEIEVGSRLGAGTLETLTANSWATLKFVDGSIVTISGQSVLTISEKEQKGLYLREGSLSADVAPQPKGKPMLIDTPTAKIEVLGTQLSLDTKPSTTILRVSEGQVRMTRLVDGSITEMPAEHQVIASINDETALVAQPRLEPVNWWKSNLPNEAVWAKPFLPYPHKKKYLHKKKSPHKKNGSQKARPFLIVTGHISKYGSSLPVVLTPDAKFRLRGWIESDTNLEFGISLRDLKGGFVAKYTAEHRFASVEKERENLDIELTLADFKVHAGKTSHTLIGLRISDWWCRSSDQVKFNVSSLELIPAEK